MRTLKTHSIILHSFNKPIWGPWWRSGKTDNRSGRDKPFIYRGTPSHLTQPASYDMKQSWDALQRKRETRDFCFKIWDLTGVCVSVCKSRRRKNASIPPTLLESDILCFVQIVHQIYTISLRLILTCWNGMRGEGTTILISLGMLSSGVQTRKLTLDGIAT